MKKFLTGAASVLFVFGLTEVANAQLITVFDNIPTTQYMNVNSGNVWGQFDISSALTQNGTYPTPYQINNAKIVLTFVR